jgi:hypothetical protein
MITRLISRFATAAALASLLPALAAAQPAPSPAESLFHACYVPGTGTVYRIKERGLAAACAAGHVPFTWGESSRVGPSMSSGPGTTAAGGSGGGSATAVKVGDAAGGDLGGTYPNPVVSRIQGQSVSAAAPSLGQVLTWDGAAWGAKPATGVSAHGQLTGLANDDHPQYLRADGSRALASALGAGGNKITGLAAATAPGDAVRYEQAVKSGDAAAGDLTGTFPAPTVSKLAGRLLSTTTPTDGQVLRWNGSTATWEPATPASGGVSAHAQLSGLTNDDHPQYLLAGGSRSAPNGFAVTGSTGAGSIAATGAGTRMLWYPGKASFRAGSVDGAQWDANNMSSYTAAFGYNTTASGTYAAAFGTGTTAGGSGSLAFGGGTTAGGTASFAGGGATTANGSYSAAFGSNTTVNGSYSVGLGSGVTVGGTSAFAAGASSTANGDYGFAGGNRSSASGTASVALGSYAGASGLGSVALGIDVIASAANAVAVGTYAGAYYPGSFVFGDGSTGSGRVTDRRGNQFVVRAAGGTEIYSNGSMSAGVVLAPGSGAWSTLSDVTKKTNFRAVDGDAVLDKLARMDIREWNYTSQDASVRHVGPTAQDFRAAFGLGEGETTISSVDADGVSLLSVQALTRRVAAQRDEIATLRAAVLRLEERLRQLETARR